EVLCQFLPLAHGGCWGRPIAAAPCTPGLWRTKSPLRGALDLSLTATGSAILTPPTPVRFVIKAQEYL
ncbi:hypothetical protein ACQP8G_08790, partial [Escherichia coli]|uniref:hypothetical protein n=1 Tax=Escherichia coli TaxID=562 RepID=UPI003D07A2D4